MLESVTVKQLVTVEEIEQAKALELEIWNSESLPMHQTLSAIENGGFLIGAYLSDELIGISYSFPGFVDGEVYLYSHMLGIKRKYREMGVGELIKLQQKELALEHGYNKCKWAFDPLEAYVAYLYFTRLQANAALYVENSLSDLHKSVNSQLPSDRLIVEWSLHDAADFRWLEQLEELLEQAEEVVDWSLNVQGLPVLDAENSFQADITYLENAYLLPVPQYFSKIKVESPALAEDWRYKSRKVFQTLFNQGYAVVYVKKKNDHICHYLVVKKSILAI